MLCVWTAFSVLLDLQLERPRILVSEEDAEAVDFRWTKRLLAESSSKQCCHKLVQSYSNFDPLAFLLLELGPLRETRRASGSE